jgi:hypothetical protein
MCVAWGADRKDAVLHNVQFIFYVINLLHKQRPPTQPSFSNRTNIQNTVRVLQKMEFVELNKCAK